MKDTEIRSGADRIAGLVVERIPQRYGDNHVVLCPTRRTEATEIRLREPDSKLFEIPKDHT